MLITETLDGLVHNYSDQGKKIRQVGTGRVYNEAWDFEPCTFTYEEINSEELTAEEVLDILLGGDDEQSDSDEIQEGDA